MKRELEEKLTKAFPSQFVGRNKDIRTSLMGFGCECGNGWYGLISHVCTLIDRLNAPVEWVQIKEKFGGLRMYLRWTGECVDLVHELVFHLLDTAEQQSFRTCEQCGDTKTAKVGNDHGWWRTECDACGEARKAKREW
jgi:hypothetical protein